MSGSMSDFYGAQVTSMEHMLISTSVQQVVGDKDVRLGPPTNPYSIQLTRIKEDIALECWNAKMMTDMKLETNIFGVIL